MSSTWWVELRRLLLVLAASAIIGALAGALTAALAAGLGLLAGWHIWQLQRLRRWLTHSRRAHPPETSGVWGDIYDQFYHLQRRNRQRKQRLAAIVREFQQSTAAMPDGTVVLAPDGTILWFNSAAQDLLRLRSPDDLGQRIINLIRHPQFGEYLSRGLFQDPLELDSPYENGVRLSLQVIPYGREQRLLLVRDVTRLYRLERIRRDFVANASHELRTPLTVIAGYLQSMSEDDDPALKPWRAPVEAMATQAARMQGIVQDMLMLSRLDDQPQPGVEETVDIAELVSMVCRDSKAIAESGLKLACETDHTLGLHGCRSELHSLLANLVANAVKYTPGDGDVAIRWYRQDTQACLEVSDTGIGIDARHIPRLTERFYRVDEGRAREQGGTGLGLAIVKHVLQRHGGELEIESQPGKGSVFRCRFPASRVIPLRGERATDGPACG